MNKSRNVLLLLNNSRQKAVESYRNLHVVQVLNHGYRPESLTSDSYDNSLFFTNLPNKRREKKVKPPDDLEPRGRLIINCKNTKFNFYGKYYKKFDVVPLASQGWKHRRAKNDYFTILASETYSPFKTKENLPTTFEENEISKGVIEQLKKINVNYPTAVQAKLFQKLLAGDNVFLLAECGSGKTTAYLVAMVENILKWRHQVPEKTNSPLGIIVLPSRELVLQVSNIAHSICSDLGLKCEVIMSHFLEALVIHKGSRSDILICTMPALLRGMKCGLYSTKYTKHVVIDDVHLFETRDKFKTLEIFFKYAKLNFSGLSGDDVTTNSAQICFVSSTMPKALEEKLSDLIMGNSYEHITTPYLHKVLFNVPQKFLRLKKSDMPAALLENAKQSAKNRIPTLIFSNRDETSQWVSKFLVENGVDCLEVNKVLTPAERLKNLYEFQEGDVNILSTTNILSHGVHFPKLKRVISYEFPLYMPDYVCRCGRLGRLNQDRDCSITHFISRKVEVTAVQKIEKAVRLNLELPHVYYPRQRLGLNEQ